jgi:hypothetical protein
VFIAVIEVLELGLRACIFCAKEIISKIDIGLSGGGLMALCGGIYTVNALARANGVRTVIPGEEPDHHIGGMKLDFPDVSGMFYGEGLRKVTQVRCSPFIFWLNATQSYLPLSIQWQDLEGFRSACAVNYEMDGDMILERR